MKRNAFALLLLSVTASCSFLWGPTATVKKFMAAAQKGDAAAMTQLFSTKGIQKLGLDRIKANNEQFAELCKKQAEANGPYQLDYVKETRNGDTSRVSFIYHDKSRKDSIKLVFDLSKESGAWKIDDIGGAEKEATNNTDSNADTANSPNPVMTVPPPPPAPNPSEAPGKPTASDQRLPISGGVLNSKARSLPQPPYPPIAKAAKASGTVTVAVLVDEDGNVTSARAISGHPLLQAAATAAARNAKFQPTKLSGQPVKVTGIITYNFVLQ